MKTEKLSILISMVLISLLAIGAVSAADIDDATIGDLPSIPAEDSTRDASASPSADDSVSVKEVTKEPVTANSGSFEDLNDNITIAQNPSHSGNLELETDYKNTNTSNKGIKIKKSETLDNLTIDGKGHTIDANNVAGIFIIDSSMKNVTLKNLIFCNANSTNAISVEGADTILNLINVQFYSNNNTAGTSAAITSNGIVNIINSAFSENIGGTIYANKELTITNATFTENKGSAIYANDKVTIINATFTKNTDGTIIGLDKLINITNATFTENSGKSNGGAIHTMGELIVTNVNFIKNTAELGGAICSGDKLTITNATFTENRATKGDCGAVYNDGELNIINTSFIKNSAEGLAGAIYSNDKITIINSTFTENAAKKDDAGAIVAYDDLTIINASFTKNTAGANAGAIYSVGELTIINANFTENTAKYDAGAIYANNILTITNAEFGLNTASNFGGAIYANGDSTINGAIFTENKVNGENDGHPKGGAIYALGSLDIKNSAFNYNSAEDTIDNIGEGGAIYSNKTLTINNATFRINSASEKGGAIAAYNTEESTIKQSTFDENYALYGGAIYKKGVKLSILSSNFTDNGYNNFKEDTFGGAIYNDAGDLTIGQDDTKKPSNLQGNYATKASEIYNNDATSVTSLGNVRIESAPVKISKSAAGTLVDNDALQGYFKRTDSTKIIANTKIISEIINNETESVEILINLINNATKEPIANEILIIDLHNDSGKIKSYKYTTGNVFSPENETFKLNKGSYWLHIIHEITDEYTYAENIFSFNVVDTAATIKELEERIKELEKENFLLNNTNNELNATNKALNQTNQELNATNKALNQTNQELNATNKALNQTNQNLISENKALNETNKNLTAENKKLENATKELDAKNKEITQLKADNTNLQTQLTNTQNDLTKAKEDTNANLKKVKAASKVKKSKNFKITATLNKAVKGRYVYVVFNGKSYKAKTNSKGVATITIKKSALKKLGGKKVKYQVMSGDKLINKSVKIKK